MRHRGGPLKRWLELRTAYEVAERGKVTDAAAALGVHRATVNRHIDALEQDIGAKLFLRHSRGYTLTEVGEDFLTAARKADEILGDFVARTQAAGPDVTGEVVLTAPSAIVSILMPPIIRFQAEHPRTRISVIAQDRFLKLEYGEAHIAVRGGPAPKEPDYVAQPFKGVRLGLYAHADYVTRNGAPNGPAEFSSHVFVDTPDYFKPAPVEAWMAEHIPPDRVAIKTSHPVATQNAVLSGAGIGLMPEGMARTCSDLVEIAAPRDDWTAPIWLVTHVDLHRTEKVQAMLRCIKAAYPSRSAPSERA